MEVWIVSGRNFRITEYHHFYNMFFFLTSSVFVDLFTYITFIKSGSLTKIKRSFATEKKNRQTFCSGNIHSQQMALCSVQLGIIIATEMSDILVSLEKCTNAVFPKWFMFSRTELPSDGSLDSANANAAMDWLKITSHYISVRVEGKQNNLI